MKLKKWKATGENYSYGRFEYFFLRKNAIKWLDDHSFYDRLILENRWTGDREYIKDRLKDARIILDQNTGGVEIIYKDDR